MSRGQSTQAFDTASNENAADFGNAQSAFVSAEGAIGNYNQQLAKFVSANPYTRGGEFDQTINTGLSNVADAGANSLRAALQSRALRTGQNSAADAATAQAAAQQDTRNLSTALANAQQQRLRDEAGYNQAALGASALPIGAYQSLYGTSQNAADSTLGDETQAAKVPGFWDQVGSSLAGGLGKGRL